MKVEHNRIFGLDLLRALAIIFVLIAHTITYIDRSHLLLSISAILGLVGVELFFVLSGFLIGSILIKMHNQQNLTNMHSIKYFWIRRWFRTLPNYYLALIIYACLVYLYTKVFIFTRLYELSFIVFCKTSSLLNFLLLFLLFLGV